MNKHLKNILIVIGIIALLFIGVYLAGCSPEDPTLDSFYTEGDYNIRDDDGQWVPLENADFDRWDDLRTPVSAVKLSGVKPPSWTNYKGSRVLAFSDQAVVGNEEIVYFLLQMTHTYNEGTDIDPHLHWVAEDNTGGNVRWALTYSWANERGVFPAETTIYINAPAGTTTDEHNDSHFELIRGSGKKMSSMLLCSLKRNSSDALDTYNGKDAYLLEFDIHYLKDSAGSLISEEVK